MKIAIGCDHIVVSFKEELIKHFQNLGYEFIDCGTYNKIRTHYPIYGREVALKVVGGEADLGVVLCGTGIGISNAASKVKGVRCVLVTDPISSRKAKEEYNANIISFGGRVVGIGTAIDIIQAFLEGVYNGDNKELISLVDNKLKPSLNNEDFFKNILCKWTNGYYTNNEKQQEVPMPKKIGTKGK